MYDIYKKLRDERGLTDYKVSKDTGIPRSTFTEWRSGKYSPKIEKLQKLAIYFDVPLDMFMDLSNDGSQMPIEEARIIAHNKTNNNFYTDPATAEMMQKLFESPGRRALFNAVADMDEESVQKYADFIERITHDNNQSN